jgi:pterin-4a-carbinolamine dehydratase
LYKTDGWQTTMMLVNAIGYLAEMVNHQSTLTAMYRKALVMPLPVKDGKYNNLLAASISANKISKKG